MKESNMNRNFEKNECGNIIAAFLFFIFLLAGISGTLFAAGTETAHQWETPQKPVSQTSNGGIDTSVLDLHSSEVLWLESEGVAIATRHETPVSKAPGIVTVITAEEIKHLGYRTFAEILRTVPGFEILKLPDFGDVVPAVRGLEAANKVRLMLDGHFVNSPLKGSSFNAFDDFPVQNIKKIEIIRGPGSAVYGENAFLAVINIITKDAGDIDGARISSGYGSFNTYEENVIFGKKYGKVDISGMLHYRSTDGFSGTLERDVQTTLDEVFGTSASNTPGNVHDKRQEFAMNLKVEYDNLWFHGWYNNKNRETFVGPQYVLSNDSDIENNYVFGEIGYKKIFDGGLTIKPRIYYDQFDIRPEIEAYPEGSVLAFDTNKDGVYDTTVSFPDGFIGIGSEIERIAGAEVPFDYELFDKNILTVGLEYRWVNQGNVRYQSNFNPATYEVFDAVQNLSDTYPYLKEATRRILSVYLQDTWDLTDTLNLTLGVRHDQYSDFGGATSPRTGLTWAFMKNASLKLLYGEAFRAPDFMEMYIQNNPALQGNEDLDPEIIKTYEAGLSYRFNKYVTGGLNYFYNDIQDFIVKRPLTPGSTTLRYENYGDGHVHGVEMETNVDIGGGNYLFMNYSFQDPNDDNGNDLPYVARHKGNFGVNVRYWKYINTNVNTFVSGRRSREADDARDDMPSYALLNLSVIGKEFFRTMEIQGTVFNLLDKDYNDPGTASMSSDLPRPGRSFFIGLSYQF
ncbi:MAG: TonB-dependent receptor [Candidatus Kuenenia stuttgartiensis]|nr:TonB-dependent receptor [Candidatus Kuenenia stuttgartiensis]